MAGIYIHIPFCRKACHYCNFHFSTTASDHQRMVDAIIHEAELKTSYLQEPVETIYFGGGTPSLLEPGAIVAILQRLRNYYDVNDQAEVTLEANPDDLGEPTLREWLSIGVNRLSIGVQSFFEEDLQWMNRAHNAQQALEGLKLARRYFENITIDLIYGGPTLSDEHWAANLERAASLDIPHLSCYALTVEPKTALDTMIRQKKKEDVDTEKQARQFEYLVNWARQAGYEQYEISNFAKPGCRSKHNSSYWQGKPYLGLGPSAHSFNGSERQWNVSNNALYLSAVEKDALPFEKETLTAVQQLNEYIMTSLRTSEGLSLMKVSQQWRPETADAIKKDAAIFLEQGTMTASGDHLMLTDSGKFLADGIAAELFR